MPRLSDLLPYDCSKKVCADLKNGLQEIHLLLSKLLAANEKFLNGEFESFDSLVGENGCHIRALKVAILAGNGSLDLERLNSQVKKAISKIDTLLEEKTINLLSQLKVSLREIMDQECLDLILTNDELFLFKAYLLTEVKHKMYSEDSLLGICKSSPENLIAMTPQVSMMFAKKLTDKLRSMLAESSVRFVREVAECQDIQTMISDQFSYLHFSKLACTPLFWTLKAILQKVHQEGIPIVLHVKYTMQDEDKKYKTTGHEYLLFKPEESERLFALTEFKEEDLHKPAFVIQGISLCEKPNNWKKSLEDLSLMDVILANCAAHRQYPNADKDEEIDRIQHPEYERYKALAHKRGFSLNNPSSFLIQHIYPSQPKRFFARA
ncbi:MAG: hypothetical protein K1X28_05945 [Parachlamydiales bacterium]|nr:hypothetical protein [Parachlamydiales bacterium]